MEFQKEKNLPKIKERLSACKTAEIITLRSRRKVKAFHFRYNIKEKKIMKIKYLGTAAAEGIPAMFCKCGNCNRARALGGKKYPHALAGTDRRENSHRLPCRLIYARASLRNRFFSDISTLLITHVHEDHCYLSEMTNRRAGFAHIDGAPALTIYGSEDVYKDYAEHAGAFFLNVPKSGCNAVNYSFIQVYKPTEIEGYTVTALRAYHGTAHPYIYLIEKDGKALLYAHDTDIFPDETWDYLEKSGVKLSYVSLDCTEGCKTVRYHGHMFIDRNLEARKRLFEIGAATESTLFLHKPLFLTTEQTPATTI